MPKAPIIAAWHRTHPMPNNPSLDQHVKWHAEHAAVCACRAVPKTVLRELDARRVAAPAIRD